jgi:hypothetical protein
MPINLIHFAHGVCDEFLRYLFSAFPLSDPELRDQFRRLLDRPSSLDIPLVRGPFVSLSEAFAQGDPVQQLADRGVLHPAMPGLIGYPKMYLHQQKVLEAVKEGRHVLVATGTGSGKTEAFLYPIVDDLLRQRDGGVKEGLAAVLVYPMNALANDQLDRLRDMLGGTGITFGQWVGTTPATEGDVLVERFKGSSRPAYLEARRQRRQEAQAEDRAVRPLAPPEECCSEADIRERKPRILLTNFRQLAVLSTRLPEVDLFAEAPLRYLVFDEAHTYAGATGAEVACLIRRLRALAGKKPDEVLCVGTSATLADPTRPGQHFLERWYQGLELSRGARNQLKGFDHGNAVEDGQGQANAVWATAPAQGGTRLVLTHRLLEEADGGPASRSQKWPRAFFCRQCGAMHRDPSDRCLADGCGHGEPLVPLVAFGDRLSSCPSCSTPSFRIGGREGLGRRPVRRRAAARDGPRHEAQPAAGADVVPQSRGDGPRGGPRPAEGTAGGRLNAMPRPRRRRRPPLRSASRWSPTAGAAT